MKKICLLFCFLFLLICSSVKAQAFPQPVYGVVIPTEIPALTATPTGSATPTATPTPTGTLIPTATPTATNTSIMQSAVFASQSTTPTPISTGQVSTITDLRLCSLSCAVTAAAPFKITDNGTVVFQYIFGWSSFVEPLTIPGVGNDSWAIIPLPGISGGSVAMDYYFYKRAVGTPPRILYP